jgi:putative aldouronate transport system permease protein
MAKAKVKTKNIHETESWNKAWKRDWQLYLLLLIPLALVVVFNYAAYPGLRMVFMDYKPAKGYAGSEWVGWKTFHKIFTDRDFIRALRNSIVFNLLDLITGFPMPIILALMLNELRYPKFKKVTQTILYLPHFLSWAVVGSVAYAMFRPSTGLVNIVLMNAGVISEGIPFLTEKTHWAVTYILIGVWQGMGWGTILYLAAIAGISSDLYEAAMIDGANRWQRMWHITLPGIRSTIVTLLIMNLGRIMGSNLERLTVFGNSMVKDYQYQLAVYIYEKGLQSSKFSMATAANLFQSVVGLVLVLLSDRIAKLLGEEGLL